MGIPIPATWGSGFLSKVFFEIVCTALMSVFQELQLTVLELCISRTVYNDQARSCKFLTYNGEFDPGSGRTLAACLTHASLGERGSNILSKPANG